jgi:hypothetical protein
MGQVLFQTPKIQQGSREAKYLLSWDVYSSRGGGKQTTWE